MVEHNGLDIMCPSKYCDDSSSSSPSSEQDKKIFTKIKLNLSEDYPKKNAEILSGQYGTNLLLIGAALMLAIANGGTSVREEHLLSFITCLMILQLAWMMWYILVRDRQENTQTERDVHVTTCWIRGTSVKAGVWKVYAHNTLDPLCPNIILTPVADRQVNHTCVYVQIYSAVYITRGVVLAGGLTLLALVSLIMDAFRIGYYVGYHSCVSAALGVYPVIHATHTIAQVSLPFQ